MTKKASTEYLNAAAQQAQQPAAASPQQAQQLTIAQRRQIAFKELSVSFERSASELQKVLPNGITPERITRVTLTACRKNPALLDCDRQTLIGAVFQAAQLGLEPDLLGSCYLVPLAGKVQLMIGYKGYIDMLYRSQRVISVQAFEVYTNDVFKRKNGSSGFLDHEPADEPSGVIKGYYAIVHLTGGGCMWHYMTREQIEAYRDEFSSDYKYKRAKGKEKDTVWGKHFDSMAKKTVLRQLVTWLPISVQEKQFTAIDETITHDIDGDPEYIDADFIIEDAPAE